MKTLAIINATRINSYAFEPFAGGESAFNRVLKLVRGLADKEDILILAGPQALPETEFRVLSKENWSMSTVLQAASAFALDKVQSDALVYVHADCPCLDADLAITLLRLHRNYRAEYTFADGYPPGFACEILRPRILANLAELAKRNDVPADREGLFAVIQKDINSYDIETELSPVDLRTLRFSPLCDTKRNKMAAEALWALGARSAADAIKLLPAHPELMRTIPGFLWVQITEGCMQSCSYCPYPLMVGDPRKLRGFMPADRFSALIDDAVALCDDIVVDVSLWGEPSLHPDFTGIAEAVLRHPNTTLLIETAGLGWDNDLVDALVARGGERVHWIVSLDAPDSATYESLRGAGMDESISFAERLARSLPKNAHIQAVRMKENEENLETLYRGWKKITDKVIIQKYDDFAGTLPDRHIADLSPLERLPCRHLARDMAVLLDGTVPMCKHSLEASSGEPRTLAYGIKVGNAFEDGLEKTWREMNKYYQRHCAGDYPAPCGRCDEYHTFNA